MSWQEKIFNHEPNGAPLLTVMSAAVAQPLQLMTEIDANVFADPTGPGIHRPERRPV
jgi:hypothetical protein